MCLPPNGANWQSVNTEADLLLLARPLLNRRLIDWLKVKLGHHCGLVAQVDIGSREIVGYGANGEVTYIDSVMAPFPAIRSAILTAVKNVQFLQCKLMLLLFLKVVS